MLFVRRHVCGVASLRGGIYRRAVVRRHARRGGVARLFRFFVAVRFFAVLGRVRAFGVRRLVCGGATIVAFPQSKAVVVHAVYGRGANGAIIKTFADRIFAHAGVGHSFFGRVRGVGVLFAPRSRQAMQVQIFGDRAGVRRRFAHLRRAGTKRHAGARVRSLLSHCRFLHTLYGGGGVAFGRRGGGHVFRCGHSAI